MKVPKSISFEDSFLEWVQKNRPGVWAKFSLNVEAACKAAWMNDKDSALDFRMKEVARKISKYTEDITRLELERESAEHEIDFLRNKEEVVKCKKK